MLLLWVSPIIKYPVIHILYNPRSYKKTFQVIFYVVFLIIDGGDDGKQICFRNLTVSRELNESDGVPLLNNAPFHVNACPINCRCG